MWGYSKAEKFKGNKYRETKVAQQVHNSALLFAHSSSMLPLTTFIIIIIIR